MLELRAHVRQEDRCPGYPGPGGPIDRGTMVKADGAVLGSSTSTTAASTTSTRSARRRRRHALLQQLGNGRAKSRRPRAGFFSRTTGRAHAVPAGFIYDAGKLEASSADLRKLSSPCAARRGLIKTDTKRAYLVRAHANEPPGPRAPEPADDARACARPASRGTRSRGDAAGLRQRRWRRSARSALAAWLVETGQIDGDPVVLVGLGPTTSASSARAVLKRQAVPLRAGTTDRRIGAGPVEEEPSPARLFVAKGPRNPKLDRHAAPASPRARRRAVSPPCVRCVRAPAATPRRTAPRHAEKWTPA